MVRRLTLGVVLVVSAIAGGWGPIASATSRTAPVDASVSASVLFVGDSHLRSSVGLLQPLLVDRPGGMATTFNAFGGLGADDSNYIRLRMSGARVATGGFDAIVVSLGTNDVENGAVTAGVAAHIDRIVDAAAGTPVLWLTLAETMYHREAGAASFNADLRSAVGRHPNLTLVEFGPVWDQHPEYFDSDGIHLGTAGQAAFALAVADAVDGQVAG